MTNRSYLTFIHLLFLGVTYGATQNFQYNPPFDIPLVLVGNDLSDRNGCPLTGQKSGGLLEFDCNSPN